MAQSRSYLHTLRSKVSITNILGAIGDRNQMSRDLKSGKGSRVHALSGIFGRRWFRAEFGNLKAPELGRFFGARDWFNKRP